MNLPTSYSVGAIIAVCVLVLAVVLGVTHALPAMIVLLIGLLAAARLL